MSDNLALVLMLVLVSGFFFSMWISGEVSPLDSSSNSLPEGKIKITKVIDGDTVLVEGGRTIRLEGIDADERGRPCYDIAKKRLEQLILGKDVTLEKTGESKGKYDRFLRYIFLNDTNVNLKLVREGLVVSRPSEDRFRQKIMQAERKAMSEGRGCKWSGEGWINEEDSEKTSENHKDTTSGIGACSASEHIGEEEKIVGTVEGSHKSESAVYLNLGGSYPDQCFTAVIWSDSLHLFPKSPADHYLGERVKMEGEIENYNGTPEMALEDSSQIQVLE